MEESKLHNKLERGDLAKYRKRYESVFSLYERLKGFMELVGQDGAKLLKWVVPVLAQMQFSASYETFPAKFSQMYRWHRNMKHPMVEMCPYSKKVVKNVVPSELPSSFDATSIGEECMAVLEIAEYDLADKPADKKDLKNKDLCQLVYSAHPRKFKEWLGIKRSQYKPDSLGLYVLRQMSKCSVLTFLVGEEVYKNPKAGGELVEVKYDGREDGDYTMMRDHYGHQIALRCPRRDAWNSNVPLYLGAHYVIDLSRYGTDEVQKKKFNCIFLVDGSVMTTKKVNVGDELLGLPFFNDHAQKFLVSMEGDEDTKKTPVGLPPNTRRAAAKRHANGVKVGDTAAENTTNESEAEAEVFVMMPKQTEKKKKKEADSNEGSGE